MMNHDDHFYDVYFPRVWTLSALDYQTYRPWTNLSSSSFQLIFLFEAISSFEAFYRACWTCQGFNYLHSFLLSTSS
jgi:hypothetical protein